MLERKIFQVFCFFSLLFSAFSLHAASTSFEQANAVFNEFIKLYDQYGGEQYMIGEGITQKNHILQAAYIATLAGAPDNIIVSLLVHDVGQIADKSRVGDTESLHFDHDEVGEKWLAKRGFPPFVSEWTAYHTLAKVELCDLDPHYFENLSQASKDSYKIQKEKFNTSHLANKQAFQKNPHHQDYLFARKCDDMAKIANFEVAKNSTLPDMEVYRAATIRVLQGNGQSAALPNWKENIDKMYQLMVTNYPAFYTKVTSLQKKTT